MLHVPAAGINADPSVKTPLTANVTTNLSARCFRKNLNSSHDIKFCFHNFLSIQISLASQMASIRVDKTRPAAEVFMMGILDIEIHIYIFIKYRETFKHSILVLELALHSGAISGGRYMYLCIHNIISVCACKDICY